MATLQFEFEYMNLLYNHAHGLTALLPSAGHDAILRVGATVVSLKSANVILLRDGAPWLGSSPSVVTTDGVAEFIDVATVLPGIAAPRGGAVIPRAEIMNGAVPDLPELNARVSLPNGTLTYLMPRSNKAPQRWDFVDVVTGALTRRAPTDLANLTVPVEPQRRYELQIVSALSPQVIPLSPGDTAHFQNADRPTRDTGNPPWYEIRYLLDLLDLPDIEYPMPAPSLAATPVTVRCPALHCGSY